MSFLARLPHPSSRYEGAQGMSVPVILHVVSAQSAHTTEIVLLHKYRPLGHLVADI